MKADTVNSGFFATGCVEIDFLEGGECAHRIVSMRLPTKELA